MDSSVTCSGFTPATAASGADISLSVLGSKSKQPEIEAGIDQMLEITLLNVGTAVPLTAAGAASAITVYLPRYVDANAIKVIAVTAPDWLPAVAPNGLSLILTYTGPDREWQGPLDFKLAKLKVDAPAGAGRVEIECRNMPGAPSRLTQPLPLVEPPKKGNLLLRDVLAVSLDSRGTVYVSNRFDPLANTLFLNIKNFGPEAIHTGPGGSTKASITVEFCYGSTVGALAPADAADRATKPLGSAWNIVGGIHADQTEGWRIDPATSTDPVPVWTLTPESMNTTLFGTGSDGNLTLSFSEIVALMPVGHTQVIVCFSGFWKSAKARYDDMVVTLDVVKENPPPNRGLLNFFGDEYPVVPVANAQTAIEIPLRWAMANVNRIDLITSFPGVAPYSRSYAKPPATPSPLGYDSHSIRIASVMQSGPLTATLQARNAEGAFLNALQYTTYLQMLVFADPRDNTEYPIALLGNKFWMIKNLAYDEAGSSVYANQPVYLPKYGRMYEATSQSVLAPPAGWHIPSERDWNELIGLYGDGKAAYGPLRDAAGFAAMLGGKYIPGASPDFSDMQEMGYYHCAGGRLFAGFSDGAQQVTVTGNMYPGEKISIRYVRDL